MTESPFDLEAGVSKAMDGVLFLKQALYGMRELADDYATCPNEFDPCISQVDRVEDSLVDVFEHLPAKAIEPSPDSARAGTPVAGRPALPSVGISGASTGGVHLALEVEDLGHELDLLYQALSGMQADAKVNETGSEDFDHALIFMLNMKDRLKRINGALGRRISSARLDQGSVAKTEPGRKGKEPAAPRRAPAAKGNGRNARAARA